MLKKIKLALDMIKFEHSIFALPFAFIGAFLAQGGMPPWDKILWILVNLAFMIQVAMLMESPFQAMVGVKGGRSPHLTFD